MSPKSVSLTTGEKASQAPVSAYGTASGKASLTSHFPDLSSLRKSWHSQFKEIPEIPAAATVAAEPETSGAGTKGKPPALPELPPVRPIAAVVSSTMDEELDIPAAHKISDLSPLPANAAPHKNTSQNQEDQHWEPDIGHNPPLKPAQQQIIETKDLQSAQSSDNSGTESTPNNSELVARIRQGAAAADTETKIPTPEISRQVRHDETSTPFAEPHEHPSHGEPSRGYTDKDLQEALRPLITPSIDDFFFTPDHGIHHYLEPLLRSTVRRAIAEQMAASTPFRDVPGWNKLAWKLRALMTSRTYEEILFDHTRRYQVEEVFLLRPQTRSLISYASHNPARHAKSSKVDSTVRKIATKSASLSIHESSTLKWEDDRHLVIRPGKHSLLAAIVHGSPNAVLEADLDYVLRQVEQRLGYTPEDDKDIHLHVLQPMLECCLLIQSLAGPN
ncbi:MAG: hypothetical protein ACPIGG_02155 [Akkermansiaceae bacterium]